MVSRLAAGNEVLLRYRYPDGRLQAALPMRVAADEGNLLACWLAPGTPIMYWALEDGRDPRSVPLEQRFQQPITTAARRWQGNGVLRVIPIDRPFQVLHFWDDDGAFAGWYINLEAPKTRRGARLDTVDWHLDLWVGPDGSTQWKDEDEALAAVAADQLGLAELTAARSTGQSIIEEIAEWPAPIGDWRGYRPPVDWEPPALPDDWSR